MQQEQINLFHIPFDELFNVVKQQFPNYQYDYKTHRILLEDGIGTAIGYIRLPLHVAINDSLTIINTYPTVVYLSIESGNAALVVVEGHDVVYHTTFAAYMTRKKQGFSQLKYLKKKGKSRAGSRVRLAEGEAFFENINETLAELFEDFSFDRIAIDCTVPLLPHLFQSSVDCPFDKQDERLYKIPLHLPQSNFTNLEGAIKKLKAPVLFCNERFDMDVSFFKKADEL